MLNKKRIREIIEKSDVKDIQSLIYDLIIIFCVFFGLFPLLVKNIPSWYYIIEIIIGIVYTIDLILRIYTKNEDNDKSDNWLVIIDILSIIASFNIDKILKLIRIFQLFKLVRYSKSLKKIFDVIYECRKFLYSVFLIVVVYILISAILFFNIEPDKFNTIFEAIYYSTISILSIGYGDIICTTYIGRLVTMLSGIFGIAIVGLPTAILTAYYMKDIMENKKEKVNKK